MRAFVRQLSRRVVTSGISLVGTIIMSPSGSGTSRPLRRQTGYARNVDRRPGSSVATLVIQSGLFPGRFPAQVFLFGGVNADYFAVGDKQRNHDL